MRHNVNVLSAPVRRAAEAELQLVVMDEDSLDNGAGTNDCPSGLELIVASANVGML